MSTKAFITVAATVFSLLSCAKSVNYEQFGAKGDGVTDDFPAIIAAHKAANERGLPVKVAAKTYYIGKTIGTAEILTDVDFGKASFIIDDRDITPEERYANIFSVNSASEPFDIEGVASLKRGQKSLGVTLPGRCLIEVENNNKKVYIRFGPNQNNGTGEKEFFIADSQGKIEEASAIVWDYDEITKMKGRIIDEKPLVIKGGTFTTLANRAPSEYTYYGRGFQIARSNARLENITHYIEEELDHGAPYSGFMTFSNAADITVSNCLFTAHKTYRTIGSASTPVSMGSYDISAYGCINIVWEHCRQTTDIDDAAYWGLMGSNFCKNLKLEDCIISRFDAHQGVRNVTLKNSVFGYMGVQMVGFGTMYIDNCEIHRNTLISLRDDYGSSWDGEIIIKNSKLVPPQGSSSVTIISGYNSGKHDFGYLCALPDLIELENMVIDDSSLNDEYYKTPYIFAGFGRNAEDPDLIPYKTEGVVSLTNVSVSSGKQFELSPNPNLFKKYEINIQ